MADVNRRCGCRDEDGKQYGARCPKLKNSRHGTWGYRMSAGFDPATGKRRYVTSYKYDSADAAKKARNADEKKLLAKAYKFEKVSVGDYLVRWLDRQERHSQLKPSTVRMYRRYVDADLVPALGRLQLVNLRKYHVAQLVADLQDAGRGPVTIKRIHATLSSALSDAEEENLIDDNPAARVRLPRIEKKRIQVWEPVEAGAFLDAATEHRLGALFEIAVLTGMRRGELCGLRWSDVDLPGRKLKVRVQLVQVGKDIVEGTIKTDAGQDRTVALSDRAVAALVAWQIQQTGEREQWGEAYQPSGRVFTYEDGRQLRPGYPSKLFDQLVAKGGFRRMRFHDLRHLHASLMLASGEDMGIVSKSMGHATSQITRDLYAHMVGETARSAVEGAAAILPPRSAVKSAGVLTSVITGQ
jgi:integrase